MKEQAFIVLNPKSGEVVEEFILSSGQNELKKTSVSERYEDNKKGESSPT